MTDYPRPIRKWGFYTEQLPWDQTLGGIVLSPALDFVIRTCEIILVTGAFEAAAIATGNNTVQVIATIMYLALFAHLGLALARFIMIQLLTRPKRVTVVKFFVAMTLAISLPFLASYLAAQIGEAARAIATSAELTTV